MKYFYLSLLAAALLFGCGWLFNHFNPWVGIIAFLNTVAGIVAYINHQIKKHTK